jgi:hypothetical protein
VAVYEFKTGAGGSPNRLADLPKVADGAGTGKRICILSMSFNRPAGPMTGSGKIHGRLHGDKIYGLEKNSPSIF